MNKPTCSNCISFHKIDDTCHFNPPTVCILMVADAEMQHFQPQTFCAFPSTTKHEWCAQHAEATQIVTLNH